MEVSLENLSHGGVIEKFDYELKQVVANIIDPNTQQDYKREIVLKVSLKPGKADRGVCSMGIVVTSKLAPTTPIASTLAVGITQNGELAAKEYLPTQGELFVDEGSKVTASGNVVSMSSAAAAAGR